MLKDLAPKRYKLTTRLNCPSSRCHAALHSKKVRLQTDRYHPPRLIVYSMTLNWQGGLDESLPLNRDWIFRFLTITCVSYKIFHYLLIDNDSKILNVINYNIYIRKFKKEAKISPIL